MRLARSKYHVGNDGVSSLMEKIIQNCGYTRLIATAKEMVLCYKDIIVHQMFWELWYNSYFHTTGPQIDQILQKSLTIFPRLESTTMAAVVTFYDQLQEVSMNHLMV
jgi:hypothetical protein